MNKLEELVKDWFQAGVERRRSELNLRDRRNEEVLIEKDLVSLILPSDAKPGEKIAFWVRHDKKEILLEVSVGAEKSELSIRSMNHG